MGTDRRSPASDPAPVTDLERFSGAQRECSEEDFLSWTDHSNRFVELVDGKLEWLPAPSEIHQSLISFLWLALLPLVEGKKIGKVHFSGIRLRLWPRTIRLPDIIFLHKNHFHARHNRVWDGADLIMEVVGDDGRDRQRVYEVKLRDYAEARIAEYWIVDPERRVVIVNRLEGAAYAVHGEFAEGTEATSVLLPEFSMNVSALFAEIDDIPD